MVNLRRDFFLFFIPEQQNTVDRGWAKKIGEKKIHQKQILWYFGISATFRIG